MAWHIGWHQVTWTIGLKRLRIHLQNLESSVGVVITKKMVHFKLKIVMTYKEFYSL